MSVYGLAFRIVPLKTHPSHRKCTEIFPSPPHHPPFLLLTYRSGKLKGIYLSSDTYIPIIRNLYTFHLGGISLLSGWFGAIVAPPYPPIISRLSV